MRVKKAISGKKETSGFKELQASLDSSERLEFPVALVNRDWMENMELTENMDLMVEKAIQGSPAKRVIEDI